MSEYLIFFFTATTRVPGNTVSSSADSSYKSRTYTNFALLVTIFITFLEAVSLYKLE